jgi:hypothetical protein
MEQDNKLREKLNTREIQPSSQSWDRLDAMLSLEEKPKKKAFPFFYIAASVLFAIGITFWFTNENSEVTIPKKNQIVITNENVPLKIEEIEKVVSNEISNNKVETVLVENIQKSKIRTQNAFASQKTPNNSQQLTVNKQAVTFKYISPENLLASVENGNQNQISIAISKPNQTFSKVNANALLSSVEVEIDKEYKESTLDKLKRNFNQVKTAVANRNYE